MRLLFLGDVVGRPGRIALTERLPQLRARWGLDCVVVNGENAAAGYGITEAICQEILDAGADAVTLGNHSWDQREALVFIERQPRLVRPANYPPGTPGRGAAMVETDKGQRVLVVNAMGRVEMEPLDCPFRAVEEAIGQAPLREVVDAIVLDIHAEATSEKQAFGWNFDGRVSLTVGTHTHVPTADTRILPGGSAFQTDAGMCGDYHSVIGFDRHEPVRRLIQKTPLQRWEAASGMGTLCGVAVETDDRSGLAVKVSPVRIGPALVEQMPLFWEN
jgi:2',3'-cyclic-nucleotide 2'-phosphodiesterase